MDEVKEKESKSKTSDYISCIFCDEQIKDFGKEGMLIAWRDDKADPKSLDKEARTTHFKCFGKFIFLNMGFIHDLLNNKK